MTDPAPRDERVHTCGTAPSERHCSACWWGNYVLGVIVRDVANRYGASRDD